jgi:putative transcriptional regulator
MLRTQLAGIGLLCATLALALAQCRAGDDAPKTVPPPSGSESGGKAAPVLAGRFLVASLSVKNSPFEHAVVLILRNDDDGTIGLVVNRKSNKKAGPFPVFNGGPCPAPGAVVLHGNPDWLGSSPEQWKREVAPGICVGDDADWNRANEATGPALQRVRVFTGCAGWAPGQLGREMWSGAWLVVPASGRILFDTDTDTLWERLSQPAAPPAKVQ